MRQTSIKDYINKYKKINKMLRLVINGAIVFLLWTIFYEFLRDYYIFDFLYEEITFNLTNIQLFLSKILLNLFSYEIDVYGKIIRVVNGVFVHLDRGCLGRNPLGMFVGFIIAFPGENKHKIWFIPFGIMVISILNVLRIVALVITNENYPQYMEINHHLIFKYIVYFFIFVMWAIWVKKTKN